MDIAALIVAIVLGGGGVIGAAWNWYTFHKEELRQKKMDVWDAYERQAASAEKRGDLGEVGRIRSEYELQLEAWRAQQEVRRLAPPDEVQQL